MGFSDLPTLADQGRCAPQKPQRGSAILARDKADAERKQHEREVADAVKKRDGYKCRWPEAHKCRGGVLEAAHLRDKGMGGDHGIRTFTANEITFCPWIHRRGPESIHGKQLKVEPETAGAGANGPCSFWKKDDAGEWFMVARELHIGGPYARD